MYLSIWIINAKNNNVIIIIMNSNSKMKVKNKALEVGAVRN